jgi:DNA-binding transcriptional ArsR family regulator
VVSSAVRYRLYGNDENWLIMKSEAVLSREFSIDDNTSYQVFNFFRSIYREDVRYKIIHALSKKELATLRGLARQVGLSHKNLRKYLNQLIENGIVESYPVGVRMRIYRLSKQCDLIKEFFMY